MAFSSQAFVAPSVSSKPKLGKKTVSSSIFRSAVKSVGKSTTIKVPKGMGYGGGASSVVDSKYLKTKDTPIEQTLVETNNILVEIQNQLALDFAYRISKEEEEIKRIRGDVSRQKKISAEKNIESSKKLGSTIKKVSDKVLSPAVSLIDRIKNFFGAIIQGFVLDKFLVWFSKEENQKKVEKVFNFIGKNWKVILGIIGGVIIGRVVYKIVRLFRALRGVARFLRTGRFSRPQTGGGEGRRGGGIFRNAQGQRRGSLNIGSEVQSRVVPGRFNAAGGAVRENVEVITRQKGIINKALQGVEVSAKKFSRNIIKSLGMGPGQKTLQRSILKFARPILKRIPFVGAILDFALSVALGEDPGRAAFGAIGAGLLGAIGTFLGGPVGTFIGGFAGDWAGRKLYDFFFASKGQEAGVAELEKPQGLNKGGIVTGKNVGNRDSVLTNLTVGELVWDRPLVNSPIGAFGIDAVYNGPDLINSLANASKEIFETSNIFAKVNKDFKESIESIDNNSLSGSTSPASISPSSSTQNNNNSGNSNNSSNISPVSPTDTATGISRRTSSGGGVTVLPPVTSNNGSNVNPSLTSSSHGGSSMPILSAVDEINNYIPYMINQLGLVGV